MWFGPGEEALSQVMKIAYAVAAYIGYSAIFVQSVGSLINEHSRHPHPKAILIPIFTGIERCLWLYVGLKLICAFHAPLEDAKAWVKNNPEHVIAAAFGLLTLVFLDCVWRFVNRSPYAEVIGREPIDRESQDRSAIHEAGHALFYAALDPLPPNLRACVAQTMGADDTMAGFVAADRKKSSNHTANYLEWRMLMALAGVEAEYVVYDDPGQGGAGDYENWQEAAKTWLKKGHGESYYLNPKSNAEAASNRDVLTRLRFAQIATVRAFLRDHEQLLQSMADEIRKRECSELEALRPYLVQVDFTSHAGIPQLKIA
ncbi:Peptidase family M41 [Duganella sacchari]|uniref:Peptidase family M41 n=2 Tax=Duganella sacchari TaxID=551987 RepID=A0A1M7RA31_9BURK|nr:Peptidase family M41 [Duganella sacchari]